MIINKEVVIMALNSDYMIAPSLEMYFVDKDTGLPLANGKVFFFQDRARTLPQPVFELSGTEPNYTYTELPNPVILSSVGTFQDDSGNDIIPYYFPFINDVITGTQIISLYYIEVYNSDGVLQFTRQAWPNFIDQTVLSNNDITNFIPNGQFLFHTNVPASTANSFVAGKISSTSTNVEPGGWYYENTSGLSANDFVTFTALGTSTNFSDNPVYAIIVQTGSSSDSLKCLALRFPGVSTFASDVLPLNFYFEGMSNSAASVTVNIVIKKFFGSGGSATQLSSPIPVTLTLNTAKFNTTLLFGSNAGDMIGPNGDDYVEIQLQLPPTAANTVELSNFALTLNDTNLTEFPTQDSYQQTAELSAGSLPQPAADGSDLYLPIVYTPNGFGYDLTPIGKIFGSMNNTPGIGELICDGSVFLTNDYSSDGIPYSRLQAKIFNNSLNVPIFGNGSTFSIAYINSQSLSQIILNANAVTANATPANVSGTPINGTVGTPVAGAATTNYKAYANGNGVVTGISTFTNGTHNGNQCVDNNTGMTFVSTHTTNGSVGTYYEFYITALPAANLAGGGTGLYFTYSNNTVDYKVWFKITAEGPPAAGGATLIEVDLTTCPTASAVEVANAIAQAINSFQVNTITMSAASGITSGNYFSFQTNSAGTTYNVWFKKDGTGTAPAVSNLIEVDIATGDTAANVATKTQKAINSYKFALPDLRGMFLRGTDATHIWDLDVNNRYGIASAILGSNVGSFELDQIYSHKHNNTVQLRGSQPAAQIIDASSAAAASGPNSTVITINEFGGTESRPVNAFVTWMIKY